MIQFEFHQAMGAVFFNKGENCIAAGRLFVAESIHDEFLTKTVRFYFLMLLMCVWFFWNFFWWKLLNFLSGPRSQKVCHWWSIGSVDQSRTSKSQVVSQFFVFLFCYDLKIIFIWRAHFDKLIEYCEKGVKEGAKLVIGGGKCNRSGKIYWI